MALGFRYLSFDQAPHVTLTPNRVETSAGAVAGFGDFPATAPAANPVFYRTYSRKTPDGRESWSQVGARNLEGLRQLGNLSTEEVALLARMQAEKKALPSPWAVITGIKEFSISLKKIELFFGILTVTTLDSN